MFVDVSEESAAKTAKQQKKDAKDGVAEGDDMAVDADNIS